MRTDLLEVVHFTPVRAFLGSLGREELLLHRHKRALKTETKACQQQPRTRVHTNSQHSASLVRLACTASRGVLCSAVQCMRIDRPQGNEQMRGLAHVPQSLHSSARCLACVVSSCAMCGMRCTAVHGVWHAFTCGQAWS